MTKKLLPAMIGVALVGGMAAAQADVTVFGHIDTSVVNWDNVKGQGRDDTNFFCTTCSIGFKGSEDLGNGLKAIFKLDFQYDTINRNTGKASFTRAVAPAPTPNGGSDALAITSQGGVAPLVTGGSDTSSITDRDQWLGLAGNFGQVRVGTISTSYKSHGAMLDPGYRTVAQMRDWGLQSVLHSGAGEEGQGRATNTARYDSPDWNGLQVIAHYTLDSDETDGDKDNPYGGGVQYTNGGILVFADYITTDTGGDDDAWKVGGKFSMNNFSVFGQYESDGGLITAREGLGSIKTDGGDIWMAGGSYTMGNNTIYAAYASGDDADNVSTVAPADRVDTGYDSWEVVGIHSMSKQTLVYLGYATIDPDASGADSIDGWALGMKHKF